MERGRERGKEGWKKEWRKQREREREVMREGGRKGREGAREGGREGKRIYTHTIIIQNENICALRVNDDIREVTTVDIEVGSESLSIFHHVVLQYGNRDWESVSS